MKLSKADLSVNRTPVVMLQKSEKISSDYTLKTRKTLGAG